MDYVPDCVLFNGNLLTQDSASTGSAIAIADGTIVAVGDDRSIRNLAQPQTALIDLDGNTLVPGFEDAHAHVWKMGHLLTTMLDLRSCTSFADSRRPADTEAYVTGRKTHGCKAAASTKPKLAEQRRPTRADLDRWVPDRPSSADANLWPHISCE